MPVTDRREPAVYVSIEDASYVAPTSFIGRTVFCVGLCEKGRHNRIVEITSHAAFKKEFGRPDFRKTSKSHYIMDKAMQYTGRGLYIRVMPEDSKLANAFIKTNNANSTSSGNSTTGYTFPDPGTGSAVVEVDPTLMSEIHEGNFIFAAITTGVDHTPDDVRQVISKDTVANTITLNAVYTGPAGCDPFWGVVQPIYIYTPYIATSTIVDQDTNWTADEELSDGTIVYAFRATGSGDFYNRLKIKGSRNIELEKMYTDDNGVVKFPYLFMNIGVYQTKDDGSADALVEGPWAVSLTDRTPDGVIIRDLTSGNLLYIEDVINTRSELLRCKHGNSVLSLVGNGSGDSMASKLNRLRVMLLMSSASPIATANYVPQGNSLAFSNGTDGAANPLYDNYGNINDNNTVILGLCAQAYMGSLPSIDGTIEQLREVTYPWFEPDYVITGGFPDYVQNAGRDLADYRQDCFHIGDTGFKVRYTDDLVARLDEVPWNNWTSMLYTQYRRITDIYTGRKIWVSPVYHAIERHLTVDAAYFIAEPVAGIEKGAIAESIELAYKSNHTERGDLMDAELNCTIVEPQGKYFLTQFTTWKRLSILKRAHAAKFVCYVRKMLPPLLKDILQRKATPFWINQAQTRVDYFLSKFKGSPVEAFQVLSNYTVNVQFDEMSSELNIYITLKPLRVIERINVYISVQ